MNPAPSIRARSALLVCAGLLAACGGLKPLPAFVTSTKDDPKFPRSRYLVEVGSSTQAAADAELQAKALISNDVSSVLTSETRSFLAASGNSESQTASAEVTQKTHFDRADLIAIIERAEANGTFYARAVLERNHADNELARAQAGELISFTQFVSTALDAARDGKPGDFATAGQRATKLTGSLGEAFILRRAVLGHPSEDERQYLINRNALVKAMADADSHRVIEVRIDGAPSAVLLQLAVSAVRKLGLRVGENQTCAQVTDHPAEATELVLSPEETCSEGSLGEKCEVAVRLHARGCLGGGEGEGRTPQKRGIHPSDRERARTDAWKRITSEMVESAVGQALHGAQVIACTSGTTGC